MSRMFITQGPAPRVLFIVLVITAPLPSARADAIDTSPRFSDGFKWSGDARVRYEGIWDDTRAGFTSDRDRGRFSLRLGFTKPINPSVLLGFRIATGTNGNPASTFQSFTGAAAGKAINVDQLYLDVVPLKSTPNLHAILGKNTVPFRTSSLVWDKDVSLEGISETYKYDRYPFTFFAVAGQYFLEDNAGPDDPYTLGEQIGFDYAPAGELGLGLSLAGGIDHTIRPYGITPTSQSASNFSSGRHVNPSGYSVLDLYGSVANTIAGIPVKLAGGWIENLAAGVTVATGVKEDDGWTAEMTLGKAADQYSWELAGGYRLVEADATLGQFTESEFSTSAGNTDIRGWFYRFAYVPWTNTTWTVSGAVTEGASTRAIADRVRLETNLAVKF